MKLNNEKAMLLLRFAILLFLFCNFAIGVEYPQPLILHPEQKSKIQVFDLQDVEFKDGNIDIKAEIRNSSSNEIIVDKIVTSCGCATIELPGSLPVKINPNESGKFLVRFDLSRVNGNIDLNLAASIAGEKPIVVRFLGKIRRPGYMIPAKARMLIRNKSDRSFNIAAYVDTSFGNLTVGNFSITDESGKTISGMKVVSVKKQDLSAIKYKGRILSDRWEMGFRVIGEFPRTTRCCVNLTKGVEGVRLGYFDVMDIR